MELGRRWESGCPLGRSLPTGGIWVRGKPPSPGGWPRGWAMGIPSPAPPIPLLRQHRTIASADLSGSFAPFLQFQKREIHTVFPRFRNFELAQNLSLRFLAELCGVTLPNIRAADCPCFISICTGSALPRICETSAGRTIWTGGCLRRGVERKRSGGPGGGHDRFHREAGREYPAHHHRPGVASAHSFPSGTRRAFPMEVREK